MPKFLITNTYKYTQTLEVNAPNKTTALEMAALLDDEFLHNNDDWVYDQEIKELKWSTQLNRTLIGYQTAAAEYIYKEEDYD